MLQRPTHVNPAISAQLVLRSLHFLGTNEFNVHIPWFLFLQSKWLLFRQSPSPMWILLIKDAYILCDGEKNLSHRHNIAVFLLKLLASLFLNHTELNQTALEIVILITMRWLIAEKKGSRLWKLRRRVRGKGTGMDLEFFQILSYDAIPSWSEG